MATPSWPSGSSSGPPTTRAEPADLGVPSVPAERPSTVLVRLAHHAAWCRGVGGDRVWTSREG